MRAAAWTSKVLGFTLLGLTGCGGGGDGGTTPPPPPPTVASVAVTIAAATITVGQTTAAAAVPRTAQGATVSGKTATWASASPGVATVDANGTVTGVTVGTAQINATIDGVSGGVTVAVTPAPVATVAVTLSARSLSVGQTTQAAAVLKDAAGNTLTGRTVTWTSSNTAVATVNTAGLVTAIAEGKSAITGTSEGRSGLDSVTVTAAVTLSELTLLRADGTPLDPANVAGSIRVEGNPVVPPGFRGTLETKIGNIVVDSDSIFGSTTTSRMGKDSDINYIRTTQLRWTYVSDQLRALNLVANGGTTVTQTLGGVTSAGQSISVARSKPITIRNVDVVRLHAWPERLITIDGRVWQTGKTNFLVEDISYSGAPLDSITIGRIAYAPSYSSSAQSGVISLFTQRSSDIGKLVTLTVSGESDTTGVRFVAATVTRGGVTTSLGTITGPAVDGSQLATRGRAADDYTLPAGLYYQATPRIDKGVIAMEYDVVDERAIRYDNLAPSVLAGGVEPPSRQLTVGQAAFDSTNRLGLSGNMLGNNTDLTRFVNYSKFSDKGTGLEVSASLRYYRSTSVPTPCDSANVVSSVTAIAATSTPTYGLSFGLSDRAGNWGCFPTKTNAANPTGVGGNALFGRLTSGGSTIASGFTTGMSWGRTNWAVSPTLRLQTTGSYYSANGMFGYVYADAAGVRKCLYGLGNSCDQSVVLGGTLGQNGTQLTYDLPMLTLKQRRAAVEGGSGNGLVVGAYWAGDLGGNWAMGGYSTMTPFYGVIDDVSPNAFLSATFPTVGMVTATGRGTDNFGIAEGRPGVRFNYSSPVFFGNRLYSIVDAFPMGGDYQTGFSTDGSLSWTAPVVKWGRMFDPVSGAITNTTFPADGGMFEVADFAWNTSRAFLDYANTFPVEPVPAGLQQVFYGLSGTQVCNGTTCAGNVPRTVNMWLDAITSTSTPPFAKASFNLIPPDGVVEFAGKVVTPVSTQVGSSWRHRYELNYDPTVYCMRSFNYLAKVMALSSSGTQAFFPNQFRSLNLVAPSSGSNRCPYLLRDIKYTF